MRSAGGDIDQVARFDRYGKNGTTFGMNVKQTSTFDRKANFVLTVSMLFVEFRQHFIQPRRVGLDVNHIRRLETALLLETLDFRSVGVQDLIVRRVGTNSRVDIPCSSRPMKMSRWRAVARPSCSNSFSLISSAGLDRYGEFTLL